MQALLGLDRAEERLHQAVEHLRLGERPLDSAVRAVHVGQPVLRQVSVLGLVGLLELVGPEPPMAGLALGERVHEGVDVTRGNPHVSRQDDRRVEPDHVVPHLDRRPPPLAPDVLLELDTERAVVPGGARTAVDLPVG